MIMRAVKKPVVSMTALSFTVLREVSGMPHNLRLHPAALAAGEPQIRYAD